jgi:cytochrome c-type biogenesis protein CcmH
MLDAKRSSGLALFWFLAGVLSTLAVLTLMLPWLRSASAPRALPWQAAVAAVLVLTAALGLYRWLGRPELAVAPRATPAPLGAVGAAMDRDAQAASTARAGSMSSAIAQLQARLAKGGGSDGDWELLAKSYEFIGLPREAAEARAHRLPPQPNAEAAVSAPAEGAVPPNEGTMPPAEGTVVRGEVTLAAALRAKASPGATLFIVAKAPALPGPPVAVIRRSVSAWPVAFTLDDSQSMMPGRTLSSAGKVIVEARISLSGQAMPAPGDLVGTSGEIDPAANRALTITIDHVVQ